MNSHEECHLQHQAAADALKPYLHARHWRECDRIEIEAMLMVRLALHGKAPRITG